MYYKIPDASGIFANNIIKIKNFCFEFKELNSRLFYGNFLSNQYNGRLKSPAKMGQKKREADATLHRSSQKTPLSR